MPMSILDSGKSLAALDPDSSFPDPRKNRNRERTVTRLPAVIPRLASTLDQIEMYVVASESCQFGIPVTGWSDGLT